LSLYLRFTVKTTRNTRRRRGPDPESSRSPWFQAPAQDSCSANRRAGRAGPTRARPDSRPDRPPHACPRR